MLLTEQLRPNRSDSCSKPGPRSLALFPGKEQVRSAGSPWRDVGRCWRCSETLEELGDAGRRWQGCPASSLVPQESGQFRAFVLKCLKIPESQDPLCYQDSITPVNAE